MPEVTRQVTSHLPSEASQTELPAWEQFVRGGGAGIVPRDGGNMRRDEFIPFHMSSHAYGVASGIKG